MLNPDREKEEGENMLAAKKVEKMDTQCVVASNTEVMKALQKSHKKHAHMMTLLAK
ncbi:MAG: hypothetical protein H6Q13_3477 [Bacteroidetes bacterium]|nr:hypothetical protein [Bacteroidota bacterium]